MANMTHEQAIEALCGCAATVTVLSYREAIEGYFKLRGLAIPPDDADCDPLARLMRLKADEEFGARYLARDPAAISEMEAARYAAYGLLLGFGP